jgi:hypothetical protein
LFAAIKLAVLHYEKFDETTLELELVELTMKSCNNDVMHFLATAAALERRFRPWGNPSRTTNSSMSSSVD